MTGIANCGCGSNAIWVEGKPNPALGRIQCVKCGVRTEGSHSIEAATSEWNAAMRVKDQGHYDHDGYCDNPARGF